jgi:hypothetical protein
MAMLKIRRISLKRLFQQGGSGSGHHGHEGRVGEQGGSLPDSGGGAVQRGRDKGSSPKTAAAPKKTANTLAKKLKTRFSASSGQKGVLKAYVPKSKMNSIKTSLQADGFEAYSDEFKDDSVTSFKKDSLRIHVTPVETTEGDRLMITISEKYESDNRQD